MDQCVQIDKKIDVIKSKTNLNKLNMNQLIELIIFNNLFCVEAEYLFPSIIF